VPTWAGRIIIVLALALVGSFVWQGYEWYVQRGKALSNSGVIPGGTSAAVLHRDEAPPWQIDSQEAINAAADDAKGGKITAAEMGLDRADSIIMAAQERNDSAAPEFFENCVNLLDKTTSAHPEEQRLVEHATQVRIDLAQLRSTMNQGPALAAVKTSTGKTAKAGRVSIYAPKSLDADETFNPETAGGWYLDATMMPDDAEILLPPSTRVFADNVRVEGITFEGAAQTLDGIRWNKVTFVDTRLRYEGGQLSLHDVRFVRCTFGLSGDARGAQLANAIALGQTSIEIP
jgi:hypothetical protein